MNGNKAETSQVEIPPSMFPVSRDGKLVQYGTQRRWMTLNSSWSRLGSGDPNDKSHDSSFTGKSVDSNPSDEATAVKSLIAQLCEFFYRQGWASGTAGGCSIRIKGASNWRVFAAPSGIQKEDMIGEDVFELDMNGNIVQGPKTEGLKLSASTPLWFIVYKHRPSAKCVIHTHSMNAQMATLLDSKEESNVLRITHLEMLKGVGSHAYDDLLEIPIIDNRPTEAELSDQFEIILRKFPKTNAVLVRRHGIYAWGDSWEQAKTQLESYECLFESAIKMRQLGVDFSKVPEKGTFRVEESKNISLELSQPTKKRKIDDVDAKENAASGFNGLDNVNNNVDLLREQSMTAIPLLPADSSTLLLDIEGCTTAISFVKDTLFPFVLKYLDVYVQSLNNEQVNTYLNDIKADIEKIVDKNAKQSCVDCISPEQTSSEKLKAYVRAMVACDIKATGLKALQGHMWKSGYESGELKGHIYPDFELMLKWCKQQNVKVYIYSSGSINAQKLLFSNTLVGDLTPYLESYFDTTSGGKKESKSYMNISKAIGVVPENIVFVSDVEAEVLAARSAGIKTVISVRPGNARLSKEADNFPKIYSLLQLCGSFFT